MDTSDRVVPPASALSWIAVQEAVDPAAARHDDWIARVDDLARELSSRVCDRWPPDDARRRDYCARVWTCFEHHWRRLAGGEPLTFNEMRQRFERCDLGIRVGDANLLEEVMLAQALEFKQAKAATMFETEYMPDVRRIARHSGGERAAESVENLAADLILPREQHRGAALAPRIASYQGRTSLRSWLRSVVVHRWISTTRKAPQLAIADAEVVADPRPVAAADNDDCEDLLRPIFSKAVAAIDAEDRLLIKMLVLDNVPQQALARSLGVHTGNVTRRRQKIMERILAQASDAGRGGKSTARYDECIEAVLAGDDPDLRQTLAAVLAGALRHESAETSEEAET